MHNKGLYEKYLKRIMDFSLSLIALIILFPLICILAFLVRIKLGSPILFRQERPGLYGKIFILYKFRTMTEEKDTSGNLLPDNIRLTRFGRMLRSTSLDELPSLFNILKGELSIVGPRPLLTQYIPLYNLTQRRRHEVRPGLTGLAQVNGRNALSWEDKFDFDIAYVENITLLGDLKIILKTIRKVIIREGISPHSETTMDYFKGSNDNHDV